METQNIKPTVDLYNATDPLCSFCWAFEPVLRKFRYQYASYIAKDTIVMGGMIEKWENDGSGNGNNSWSAVDVAKYWRELGDYSRMVIDGRIWLDEPIQSSYPSSQVFEIVRRDYPEQASLFLRKLRESVMMWNEDISNPDILKGILESIDLDAETILEDAESFEGRMLLKGDLALTRSLTVTGFPTLVLINEDNAGVKVVGAQSLDALVSALKQALPEGTEIIPNPLPSLDIAMEATPLMLTREIEILYDLEEDDVEGFVNMIVGKENYQKGELLGQTYYKKISNSLAGRL